MPTDVSYENVRARNAASANRRLPLGIGLVIAALVSAGLWVAVAAAIRALFF
jgi:hypothetical protein